MQQIRDMIRDFKRNSKSASMRHDYVVRPIDIKASMEKGKILRENFLTIKKASFQNKVTKHFSE